MAAEVREWGITAVMLAALGLGIYMVYNFAVGQGWLSARYRPRLTQMRRR